MSNRLLSILLHLAAVILLVALYSMQMNQPPGQELDEGVSLLFMVLSTVVFFAGAFVYPNLISFFISVVVSAMALVVTLVLFLFGGMGGTFVPAFVFLLLTSIAIGITMLLLRVYYHRVNAEKVKNPYSARMHRLQLRFASYICVLIAIPAILNVFFGWAFMIGLDILIAIVSLWLAAHFKDKAQLLRSRHE